MSRLMVGNLSYDTNDDSLRQALSFCGQITDIKVQQIGIATRSTRSDGHVFQPTSTRAIFPSFRLRQLGDAREKQWGEANLEL